MYKVIIFKYPELGVKFLEPYNRKNSRFAFQYNKVLSLDITFDEWSELYFDAGEHVSNTIFEKEKPQIIQLDSYFLPLAFLYRHSLELEIKAILIKTQGKEATKDSIKKDFHNLGLLLNSMKVKAYAEDYKREIDWLLDFVKSLSSFDMASDSFRYPYKVVENGGIYKIIYVFNKRYDIDLVIMINQFKIANAILKSIYNDNFEEIMECSKVTSQFMTLGGQYYSKAVLGLGYDTNLFIKYNRGYEETAQILQKIDIEKYFLPICYLKRNNIELDLKTMYMSFEINKDMNKVFKQVKDLKHSTVQLWDLLKDVLNAAYPANNDESELVKNYLKQIHDFDTDAAHFRYPTDKYLTAYSSKKKYDGKHMIDFLDATYNAIDGIYTCIEEYYSDNEIPRRVI